MSSEVCPTCGGSRFVAVPEGRWMVSRPCPTCRPPKRSRTRGPCPVCDGSGEAVLYRGRPWEERGPYIACSGAGEIPVIILEMV